MSTQRRFLTPRSGASFRPRALIGVGAVSLLALSLTACGGSSDAGGGTESKALKVLIAAPQEGAGKILEQEFEAETGTDIQVEVVPYDQIQTKAILDAQSGTNNYDVIQYWYTSVGALAESGALADITSWVDDDSDIDSADFIQIIFGASTQYDGKT